MKAAPVKALIIRTAGTNCDQETIHALSLVGAESELVHVNRLLSGRVRLHPYHMIVFPGGFSYGDDIASGKVLANEIRLKLKDQLERFVESKKPVIGVCNGFQVLVKAGLLPGFKPVDDVQQATLTHNDSGRFQCEWVGMKTEKSAAAWLKEVPATFELPIAHGEGKFIALNAGVMKKLKDNKQIVFRYAPRNPNGSDENIAGLCNANGNVIGLMPHPERFVSRYQHPNWTNRKARVNDESGDGFWFWKCAVDYAKTFN
jgi:phosphoribosylformylglycinamidine synthase